MTYERSGESRRFKPIIVPASTSQPMLSFENLVEIHVLSSLRRKHEVRLDAIRRAVAFLARELKHAHPLAAREMLTDGTDVLVESYGRLINASRDGQQELRDIVLGYLERVSRDPSGHAERLFPITRADVGVAAVPKLVAIDPRIRFGQPFLVRGGIETRVIAGRYKAGDSVAHLADDFGVGAEDIEEAIRYELRPAA